MAEGTARHKRLSSRVGFRLGLGRMLLAPVRAADGSFVASPRKAHSWSGPVPQPEAREPAWSEERGSAPLRQGPQLYFALEPIANE